MLDWLITIGVFAIVSGVALRIITMMRARDAGGFGSDTLYGRDLVRAHIPGLSSKLAAYAEPALAVGRNGLLAGRRLDGIARLGQATVLSA